MNPKSKINDFKKGLEKSAKSLRGAHLTDVWKTYRRFLKRIPDISHLKNIVLFSGVATILIFIFFAQRFTSLYEYLPKKPKFGGVYSEGVVGKIEQLNPIFSPVNSAENTATSLIFSGLTKKDGRRKVVADLAQSWSSSADGKIYTFKLRPNLSWHDGHKLTSADVAFTVSTIQNPDVRSPLLEVWKDVEVETQDEQTINFKLQTSYSGFLSNTDLPIVPKHILEVVPPRNLKISEFATKPVGSGPFKFEELKTLKESEEVILSANENYFLKKPYIKKFIIKTYPSYSLLTEGYARREVLGMEKLVSGEKEKKNKLPDLKIYETAVPQYDVIYFNLKRGITKEKGFREAMALLLDRERISKEAYFGSAVAVYSPILPGFLGHNGKLKQTPNSEAAKQKIAGMGYSLNKEGLYEKDGKVLTVRFATQDSEEKSREITKIKEQIEKAGIKVSVEKYPMGALVQEHIRPRDFEMLLVTQNVGSDPDLYSFWHGTQTSDPGLNFSGFSDRRVDKFIEQARMSSDENFRKEKYLEISQILWDEVPALYVVWPNHIYAASKRVKGISIKKLVSPEDRFWNIEEWYLLDERA